MTLPRFYDLAEYWKESPPVHVILAARYGMGPKKKTQSKEEFSTMLDDLQASGVKMVK